MNKQDSGPDFSEKLYSFIERVPLFSRLIRAGGIRFKWTLLISLIILVVVLIFGLIFTIISENALMSANDRLCHTIAGNISSAESILTAEKRPIKRSMILQDIVSGLSKSDIPGLEYAAVYDLNGKLAERKRAYAAHTNAFLRGRWMRRSTYNEIVKIEEFQKERILIKKKGKGEVPVYRYRMPFRFFDVKVGIIEIVFLEKAILAPVHRARLYILLLGVLVMGFGIFISIKSAAGMVKPIHRLSNGMNSVRDGNLEIEMDIRRHDELGDLSTEFNNMINHLREKLHMQKFVSDSTINMIREHSKSGDIDLGGSRQNFAFLFSDIRGFTAMSEKMEPEEVVHILNEYLDLQSRIIRKNNGDIDKFVGDEVMAVFSGRGRADNALKAAVEIIESIDSLNGEKTANDQRVVNVGIGLHMGDVVHGRMGSRERMDNTSIGDAVNLSARLCSQADAGTILASKVIVNSASRGKFKGKKLDPIKVKGKTRPIEIYGITGMKK